MYYFLYTWVHCRLQYCRPADTVQQNTRANVHITHTWWRASRSHCSDNCSIAALDMYCLLNLGYTLGIPSFSHHQRPRRLEYSAYPEVSGDDCVFNLQGIIILSKFVIYLALCPLYQSVGHPWFPAAVIEVMVERIRNA